MNNFERRKQMHKSSRMSPPPWKDVYRKKCFERLRARRANLIEQFRFSNSPQKVILEESTSPSKLVSDVMEVEWSSINQNRSFPSLSSSSMSFEDSEEEETREILEKIQNELQNEDEMLMNQFLHYDSDELNAKIKMLDDEEVICPICKIRRLKERRGAEGNSFQTPDKSGCDSRCPIGTVECECGLAVSGHGLVLETVHCSLQAVIADHERTCFSALQFTLTKDSKGSNILITCSSCDWMTFLL